MNTTNSLVIFTRASQMLAEADTIQKAKELKSLALTAAEWAKRKDMGEEAIQYCRSYALEAERKMGQMCKVEAAAGRLATRESNLKRGPDVPGRDIGKPATTASIGITRKERASAEMLAAMPESTFDELRTGKTTKEQAKREVAREKVIEKLEDINSKKVKATKGLYDVIVIDPPWPIEKIKRDCRPNQVAFDYPTMTEEEIYWIKIPHAKDCHIWLWTTHKYLRFAFNMIHQRQWQYVCTFVWHKPGGFQPYGLPQYNCEFALYCRLGHPIFVDTKAFPVCFNAPRGAHSEKPEEFYQMVRRVTAGRRLDMFNRRAIEGFDGWGQEAR